MTLLKSISAFLLGVTVLVLMLAACNKRIFRPGCFDQQLYEAHKGKACTMDCPGVIGCDGKEYCNACIAATQGIRVK